MKLNKIIAKILLISILLSHTVGIIQAYEIPTAPTAPTAPPVPTAPPIPTAPPVPTAPPAPPAPNLNDTPTPSPVPPASADPTPTDTQQNNNSQPSSDAPQQEQSASQSEPQGEQTGNQTQNGVSDPSITTGDATNSVQALTTGNNNSAINEPSVSTDSNTGISIANSGNGSESENTGVVVTDTTNLTVQNNQATVGNSLNQPTVTGQNSTSGNVGTSSIKTGDANTSGTIITAVNTNVDGVAVSEFNIVDDHVGDIVLDFAKDCTIGCQNGDLTITNSANGANSTNSGSIDNTTNNLTFQNNDADILNSMTLNSDSGNNTADKNTGGDTSIETGGANVSASSLTFANNNISGNVVYGIVNIYGDLVGDILFPEELFGSTCCGSGQTTIANTNNGSGSTNTGTVNDVLNNEAYQFNNATIDTTLVLEAQSGQNSASKNTGGDTSIETGDTTVTAQILNVANANIDGGNWWLVLVNEAGNWIGQIFGTDPNAHFAGAPGTEFAVNDAGEISVSNIGNGSGSTNSGTINQTSNTTTVQTNDTVVTNTLNLSANTGGNTANKNTGGDTSIKTGDANVIANIVNFVNNNIIGNGKLYVTVVNVFGSWTGNFFTPGTKKPLAQNQNEQLPAIGGANIDSLSPPQSQTAPTQQSSQGTNSGSNNSNSNAGAISSPSPTPTPIVLAIGNTSGQPPTSGAFILGATTSDNDTGNIAAVEGRKNVSINLAWLILLLPCAILLFAAKRIALKLHLRRQSPAFT